MNDRKEYIKKYNKTYYELNKEKEKKRYKEWYENNKDKKREINKRYKKYKIEYIKELQQTINKQKEVLDKIKEIPLKHIDNANEELQIILRNNNDLEYKNQCSHDFDIIRQNVEIIYKDILELLEEIE